MLSNARCTTSPEKPPATGEYITLLRMGESLLVPLFLLLADAVSAASPYHIECHSFLATQSPYC